MRGTVWTRAPPAALRLDIVTAFPSERSMLDFCRFTTSWDDPNAFDAGRFSAAIFAFVDCRFIDRRETEINKYKHSTRKY